MQQSSTTPKSQDVAEDCCMLSLLLVCLLVSTVFGTVSSLHPTSFLMIFILVSLIFYAGLALIVAHGEMTHITRMRIVCAN